MRYQINTSIESQALSIRILADIRQVEAARAPFIWTPFCWRFGSPLKFACPVAPATPGFPISYGHIRELGDQMPFAIFITNNVNGVNCSFQLGKVRAHDRQLTLMLLH